MTEEVQHVCYILSFIPYQKYRNLHLLDYIYVLAEWMLGRLEFWSLVLWYLVDLKNLRLKVFVNVILSLQCSIWTVTSSSHSVLSHKIRTITEVYSIWFRLQLNRHGIWGHLNTIDCENSLYNSYSIHLLMHLIY